MLKHKRIIIKISGESLSGGSGVGIEERFVRKIAKDIIDVKNLGYEIAIVVGGGNLWRGAENENSSVERASGDYMGMLGTIMNAVAIQQSLEYLGAESRVMTSLSIIQVAEPFIRRKAMRHLEKGRIIILGGGTGLPFLSTDTTASLRAAEIGATAILMAKNGVDGIYDKDPNKNKDAKRIDTITYDEMIQKNLMIMDSTSYSFAKDNNIELFVFNGNKEGNLIKLIKGELVHTKVTN